VDRSKGEMYVCRATALNNSCCLDH